MAPRAKRNWWSRLSRLGIALVKAVGRPIGPRQACSSRRTRMRIARACFARLLAGQTLPTTRHLASRRCGTDSSWPGGLRQLCTHGACYAGGLSTFDNPTSVPASTTGGRVCGLPQNCVDGRNERTNKDGALNRLGAHADFGWVTENLSALRSSNDFVERHGLPLALYRNF